MKLHQNSVVSPKLKTVSELIDLIGLRPRKKTVVMCHGTFDIVHPGHIRHLLYAKERGDLLIASLTADQHIIKGSMRPYVPQYLRAMNLAALEMVNYVLIDDNAEPIENIMLLRPDIFVKGFEYFKQDPSEKTQREVEALNGYGGEIIFSPGDVVYSSSKLLELQKPKLAEEKLLLVMKSEGVEFDDLLRALQSFSTFSIHILGDLIVDSVSSTSLLGGMAKTPTLSVRFEERVNYVGGAGIVAKHLAAAGARVTLSTLLGDDELGSFVRRDLDKSEVVSNIVIEKSRPTTNKDVFVAGGYRLLKVDTVDNRPISRESVLQLSDLIKNTKDNAVLFSDFRHGIFNKHSIPTLISSIPLNCLKVADSQVASRWGNILDFKGFDLVTPNEREARFALGDQDTVVRVVGSELFERSQCKNLILKCGERGLMGFRSADPSELRGFFSLDSFSGTVKDPVGAGDALMAYASLGLVSTNNLVVASILGSIAASLECERDGNVPVSVSEVLDRIKSIKNSLGFS